MRMHRTVAGVVAVICAAAVPSMASVVASDSFTLDGISRTVGTALYTDTTHYLTAEVGGQKWITEATANAVTLGGDSSDGYAVLAAAANTPYASLTCFTTAPTSGTTTLSITASGLGSVGTKWFGVGFSDKTGFINSQTNKLWLLIKPTSIQLFDNSSSQASVNVTLNAGNNDIGLVYDATTNAASVTLNGAAIPAYTNVSLTNWQSSYLKVATISANGTRPGDQMVTDLAVVVPEPASVVLSALGLVGLSIRRRQHA